MDHVDYDNCVDTRNKKLDKRFEKRTRYTKVTIREDRWRRKTIYDEYGNSIDEVRIPNDFEYSFKFAKDIHRLSGCWESHRYMSVSEYYDLIDHPHRRSCKFGTSVVEIKRLHRIGDEYVLEEIEKPLFKEVTRNNQKILKNNKNNKSKIKGKIAVY